MGKRIVVIILFLSVLAGTLVLPAGAVDLQLTAPSAVLMDLATGTVLYETNAHERLAPASVTKVMTLLLIMEAIDSGKISWQDTVTASEAAAAKGGSQVYLKVGETMSVEEMVKSITVSSANDCAGNHRGGLRRGHHRRVRPGRVLHWRHTVRPGKENRL